MNKKKALLLIGLVITAGAVFAEKSEKEKAKKEETHEFFPMDQNCAQLSYRTMLQKKLLDCIKDPGKDKNCRIIREFYLDSRPIGKDRNKEDEKLLMKALSAKSEEYWKEFKEKNMKFGESEEAQIDKKTHTKLFQQVVFDQATQNAIDAYAFYVLAIVKSMVDDFLDIF